MTHRSSWGSTWAAERRVRLLDKVNPTGLFFGEQTPASLVRAVETFEVNRHLFDPSIIREHAQGFSQERFRDEFSRYVSEAWATFETSSMFPPVMPVLDPFEPEFVAGHD